MRPAVCSRFLCDLDRVVWFLVYWFSPMALTPQQLSRIAHLARLELDDTERDRLLGQLNGFFDIVEQISAVDTTGIVPLAHPIDIVAPLALRLRDDVASEADNRSANQRNAPAVEDGLFLVPRVIE